MNNIFYSFLFIVFALVKIMAKTKWLEEKISYCTRRYSLEYSSLKKGHYRMFFIEIFPNCSRLIVREPCMFFNQKISLTLSLQRLLRQENTRIIYLKCKLSTVQPSCSHIYNKLIKLSNFPILRKMNGILQRFLKIEPFEP